MSKGSKQRPINIPKDKYDANWERIFGMKETKKKSTNTDDSKKTK